MPVNIEFVGGPHDGMRSVISDDEMDWLHAGRLPESFAARADFFGPEVGRYRVTRSLTREGRLIYRFQGSSGPGSSDSSGQSASMQSEQNE